LTVIDGAYLPSRDIPGMVSPEELHYEKPEGVQCWDFPPRIEALQALAIVWLTQIGILARFQERNGSKGKSSIMFTGFLVFVRYGAR